MTGLFTFLIEAGIILMLCYLFYHLFLRKEVNLQFNRIYLSGTLVISIVIPLLHLSWQVNEQLTVIQYYTPEYWLPGFSNGQLIHADHNHHDWPLMEALFGVYCIITAFLGFRFATSLKALFLLISKNDKKKTGPVTLVFTGDSRSPFSVFRYVMLSKKILDSEGLSGILKHESIHARQFHTLDRLFVELLCILFWFNPFIYYYRRSIIEVHEYIADRNTIRDGFDVARYRNLILECASSHQGMGLISSFNHSLIKKRLIMLHSVKNRKRIGLKNLLVIPLITIILLCFGFDYQSSISLPVVPGNTVKSAGTKTEDRFVPSGMPFQEGVKVRISSSYGRRMHPIKKKEMMHYGCDLVAPRGTPIVSTADGVIEKTEYMEGSYGNLVLIRHGKEYSTMYTQLERYEVKQGQKVRKGQVIGYLGSSGTSTGPHLHYEVHRNGKRVNPEEYF